MPAYLSTFQTAAVPGLNNSSCGTPITAADFQELVNRIGRLEDGNLISGSLGGRQVNLETFYYSAGNGSYTPPLNSYATATWWGTSGVYTYNAPVASNYLVMAWVYDERAPLGSTTAGQYTNAYYIETNGVNTNTGNNMTYSGSAGDYFAGSKWAQWIVPLNAGANTFTLKMGQFYGSNALSSSVALYGVAL
jgi:hypothetical protein